MSNVVAIVNAETDYGSIAGAAVHQHTTERYFGNPKRTGVRWVAGWNYVSHYNWSVENWEYLGGEVKRRMRGGPILLNRLILLLIAGATFNICRIIASWDLSKYYLIATIFIGLVGVINTIWNWYVYSVNGSRIHQHMFYVPDSMLDSTNEFYEIPIHTRITDRQTLVIANQIGALIAQLIQRNQSSTSVKIMVYGNQYLKKIRLPFESFLMFLLSIVAILAAGYIFVTLSF